MKIPTVIWDTKEQIGRTMSLKSTRKRRRIKGAHFAAWAQDIAYHVGQKCTFGGNTYTCLIAHTSAAGATPNTIPLTWTL